MPAFSKIDKERRLVLSTPSGVFTLVDAVSHIDKLSKDPDFDPGFFQMADFTHVTRIELSGDEIRRRAQRGIFPANSRRAFITPNEVTFGIGRMFKTLRSFEGEKGIRIVRTLEEAADFGVPQKRERLATA